VLPSSQSALRPAGEQPLSSANPRRPSRNSTIAVAGPLASFLLTGIFFVVNLYSADTSRLGGLTDTLWQTNFALAVFNLLPGFPLDGGRIFRAIVWGITKNFSKATRYAGTSGKIVAYAMILFGVWTAFHGSFRSGLWNRLHRLVHLERRSGKASPRLKSGKLSPAFARRTS